MAYDATGLVPIGGHCKAGNASQLWAYKTTDTHATVDTSGYFNSATTLLKVGDVILVVVTSGGNVSTAGWHVVMSNSAAGVVNVSDVTALTVTNTD